MEHVFSHFVEKLAWFEEKKTEIWHRSFSLQNGVQCISGFPGESKVL